MNTVKAANTNFDSASVDLFNLSLWATEPSWELYETLQEDCCIAAYIDPDIHFDFPLLLGRMIRSGNVKPVDKIMKNSWMREKTLAMADEIGDIRAEWLMGACYDPTFIGSNGYLWLADDVMSARFLVQKYGELSEYRPLDISQKCSNSGSSELQDLRRFTPRLKAMS